MKTSELDEPLITDNEYPVKRGREREREGEERERGRGEDEHYNVTEEEEEGGRKREEGEDTLGGHTQKPSMSLICI